MLEPRKIPINTVAAALKQAQHYRLLNEPALAESICRDIVAVDPIHQTALITLLLALTDQFEEKRSLAFDEAVESTERLSDEYNKFYFNGIIRERWARAQLKLGVPRESVGTWIRQAMSSYMMADELGSADDPNPLLRWNTCARFLQESEVDMAERYSPASPASDIQDEFGDEVPFR